MSASEEPEGAPRLAPGEPAASTYWLTRFVLLRALGLVYLVAFAALRRQLVPLLGAHGLLPIPLFLERVLAQVGSASASYLALPTVFWWRHDDAFLLAASDLGIVLAALVVLGLANVPLLAALWALYLSFVHVGQLFYGYGWEILLCEAGFLAIFLVPPLRPWPFPRATPPPVVVLWLYRWLLFRLMLGAGLIKLRGDSCWRDLTCLVYHYETQPLPNPLSWLLHQTPPWFHNLEVRWNHLIEIAVPWLLFAPRRARHIGGALTIAFQVSLILSGNLSWLNYLTIAIAIACFDDSLVARLVPRALAARARARGAADAAARPSIVRRGVTFALAGLVGVLSLNPIANLLSSQQMMNTSFDPLDLVNTYGAFGTVGRTRDEIVIQGTGDERPDASAGWREYQLPCKPGDVERRPCVVAPFQWRLDWQMWFAAMSEASREPWLIHLVAKLLDGDPATLGLFAVNPFPEAPPRYVRISRYRYEFTRLGDGSKAWWKRTYLGAYLPPLGRDDPALRRFLAARGWDGAG